MVVLANPYGDGNHHRISWRRQWDVDVEALTATHRTSGFSMRFEPQPGGGYTAHLACELPALGPDGELAMAQMFGLRQLLKDGWDIWHTVARKNSHNALAQADAACGVSPGAMGSAAAGNGERTRE